MKYKVLALILALTVVSWAQTSNSNDSSDINQSTVPAKNRSCCDKMKASDAKDASGPSCCAHHSKDAKGLASSCSGHDGKCCADSKGKSCMQNGKEKACCSGCGKDKTANSCNEGCGKSCEKGCCSSKSEKAAQDYCQHKMQG